jgi:hypothetical protein
VSRREQTCCVSQCESVRRRVVPPTMTRALRFGCLWQRGRRLPGWVRRRRAGWSVVRERRSCTDLFLRCRWWAGRRCHRPRSGLWGFLRRWRSRGRTAPHLAVYGAVESLLGDRSTGLVWVGVTRSRRKVRRRAKVADPRWQSGARAPNRRPLCVCRSRRGRSRDPSQTLRR